MLERHKDLRDAVLRRLDLLDRAAGHADSGTLVHLARTELNRLAEGWRLLLTLHRCDDDGRCQACPTGNRGRWPCQIWRMAHEHLIGGGVPHRRRTHPLRNPFGHVVRTIAARRTADAARQDAAPDGPAARTPTGRHGLPGPRRH